jgi:hypothetical protein
MYHRFKTGRILTPSSGTGLVLIGSPTYVLTGIDMKNMYMMHIRVVIVSMFLSTFIWWFAVWKTIKEQASRKWLIKLLSGLFQQKNNRFIIILNISIHSNDTINTYMVS